MFIANDLLPDYYLHTDTAYALLDMHRGVPTLYPPAELFARLCRVIRLLQYQLTFVHNM